MKAPETIFLHGYSFDDEPCKNWTLEPIKRGMRGYAVQNETYIRKDALLEWAKEKDLSSVLHHPDRHYILIELIDKLNSM